MYIVHVKEGPVFQVTFHVGQVTLQFESRLFSAVSRDLVALLSFGKPYPAAV